MPVSPPPAEFLSGFFQGLVGGPFKKDPTDALAAALLEGASPDLNPPPAVGIVDGIVLGAPISGVRPSDVPLDVRGGGGFLEASPPAAAEAFGRKYTAVRSVIGRALAPDQDTTSAVRAADDRRLDERTRRLDEESARQRELDDIAYRRRLFEEQREFDRWLERYNDAVREFGDRVGGQLALGRITREEARRLFDELPIWERYYGTAPEDIAQAVIAGLVGAGGQQQSQPSVPPGARIEGSRPTTQPVVEIGPDGLPRLRPPVLDDAAQVDNFFRNNRADP